MRTLLLICGMLILSFFIKDAVKENKSYKINEVKIEQPVLKKEKKSPKSNTKPSPEPKKEVVYLRGLGKFTPSDLEVFKGYIKELYNYDVVISDPVPTKSQMYSPDGRSLEVSECIFSLNDYDKKTIYITDENLVTEGLEVRGGTYLNCKTVIIESGNYNKDTVLHELGHTLGLEHCDNPKCLMAIYNDEHVTNDFCDECKKKLRNEDF